MIDGLGRNFGKGTRLTVLFLGREGEEGKRPHNLVWAGIVTLGLGRIEKKRKKREKKTLQEQKKRVPGEGVVLHCMTVWSTPYV